MIKRSDTLSTEVFSERFGGKGELKVVHILEKGQFNEKGRLFARNVLKPGCSLGWHEHKGDSETYYILSGEGTVDDNGVKTVVRAGDVIVTGVGESHSIENTGDVDLEFIALILFA